MRDELLNVAHALVELGADIIRSDDIGFHAVEYAVRNWAVFPLRGKFPAIPKEAGGRGVLDATTDLETITRWWSGPCAGANIGGRVPEGMFVLDTDPRHDGLTTLKTLETRYGALPDTLTTVSGRGDGGTHRFYRRPVGKLSSKRLGPGIDVKTSTGYVVLPPSIHPDSRKPYTRIDAPIADPPEWLVELLLPERIEPQIRPRRNIAFTGPSIADTYSITASWADILPRHGWRCLDADPDADGARWLHPNATSACSATVRNGCLFVYSPNTPFDITEPSDPHGYTRFRAYAVLNHAGDMSSAARALAGKEVA